MPSMKSLASETLTQSTDGRALTDDGQEPEPRLLGDHVKDFRAAFERSAQGKLLVTLHPDVALTYVFRDDGDYVAGNMASDTHRNSGLPKEEVYRTVRGRYEQFCAELYDTLLDVSADRGAVELHLYRSEWIEQETRRKLQELGGVPLSMDPLINSDISTIEVSRGYHLGGKRTWGLTNRPDSLPLNRQIERFAQLQTGAVDLVEDDVFTGGSILDIIKHFKGHSRIQRVIPGIQVGDPSRLAEAGVEVHPIVQYKGPNSLDAVENGLIELDDPRDFLVGSSGLVVQLPSGRHGRAPYVLPFVSPADRASIQPEKEEEFSRRVLVANRRFYEDIGRHLDHEVVLGDVEPAFVDTMRELYGFTRDTPMTDVIDYCIASMKPERARLSAIGNALHEQNATLLELEKLDIPAQIVLLDVNGTLFPDESADGTIDPVVIEQLTEISGLLKAKGVSLGLCSDSPVDPLQDLAHRLGLDGVVVAENGNLVVHDGKKVTVRSLPDIAECRRIIEEIAAREGFVRTDDMLSPEFGGVPLDSGDRWAFGKGRETSVSVFGPAKLIEALGQEIGGNDQISVDCSPEYGFFGIHPGRYKENKGKTLELVRKGRPTVILVGNSMSDWVPPQTGVQCAFVGDARISEEVAAQAFFRADPSAKAGKGAIACLRHIVPQLPKQ